MACRFPLHASLYPKRIKNPPFNPHSSRPPVSSHCPGNPSPQNNDESSSPNKSHLSFLALPITLTLVSTSLAHKSALAAPKTSQKKKAPKRSQLEALTSDQLKQWAKDLPVVSGKVPYTEVLRFKEEDRLKHVIKSPGACLKQRAETVLVVLDDNRVFRTVLPSVGSNATFWDSWDELKIDALCVNAYSPPVKRPAAPQPYLGFFWKGLESAWSKLRHKKESKRAMELREERERLKRRARELVRNKEERMELEGVLRRQRKEEERRRRREIMMKEREMMMSQGGPKTLINWDALARDEYVSSALGALFFVLFYRIVVLNYRKQKKDYEDRLKIEKAEAEEKRKMRELEMSMMGVGEEEYENLQGKGVDNAYMKMAKQFMNSGARMRRARGKRLPQYMETSVDVMFTDVAGLGKLRLELEEIVKFFTHGEIYRRRGIKIPGGILLCGPPGVGKTLLAKAVAGEAGVNFFSISASQFVEIYVGVGAARVRSLYQEAKENAPSVVFIDELDAVGRKRGLIKGSGGQERDATLNQLLVCLDGFEGRGQVITIASTNRPDILDPALVRPGRFDRKIFIPKPGLIGRMEILKVHAWKKPMANDVDYKAVAAITNGMVGAELANIVEVAALNMMRDGRTEITTDDLLQAAEIEEGGLLDKKKRSPESWRQVAVNEAATAVVAANFPDLRNIEFITIAPRAGRELGYVRTNMDDIKLTKGLLSRQSLLDYIAVQLAPRAADELWYGEGQLSTIWADIADNARRAARAYVMGGLSEKHYGIATFLVAERIYDIDLQATQILNLCYERSKKILQKNRMLMDAVVDELVQRKNLTKQEFNHLVELHGCLEPTPTSIVDIRAVKRAEFQETVQQQQQQETTTRTNV